MFALSFAIGIYSYSIFLLGMFGLLFKPVVISLTFFVFIGLLALKWKDLRKYSRKHSQISFNFLNFLLLFLLLLQVIINLIGALGPELAFDALWYHLTFPKLYLLNHAIMHIPGSLLYYSDMPKFGELLYVGVLSFGNEITAKLVHLFFGLLVCGALYLFSRQFFSRIIALIAVIIFYGNLVVAWESTTAYIDLIRTFFELLGLWAFVNWIQIKDKKWFITSAIMIGLAVSTKLLALGSLGIFLVLIIFHFRTDLKKVIKYGLSYCVITLLIPLPWFIFSFIHTGNPVYPFFSGIYEVVPESSNILKDLWILFTQAADPISPIYLIILPLVILFFPKLSREIKLLVGYSVLALLVWYVTPRTGGGRFIVPYLPAFSIVCAAVVDYLVKNKKKYHIFTNLLIGAIVFVSLVSIVYRGAANSKYLPVVFGQESKEAFLAKELHFSYGAFYDTDRYFRSNVTPSDTVLLFGFHNLYYVDFPFIDSSWVKKGDRFTYIATQNTSLPKQFANWGLVYTNDKTLVKLYKPPKGACKAQCVY